MKAVFFDVGGVIVNDSRLRERLFKVFASVNRDQLWQQFNQVALAACRGEQTLADSWRELARRFGLELDDSMLSTLWIDDYIDGIDINEDVLRIYLSDIPLGLFRTRYRSIQPYFDP